ncbi:MAG: hypothetical protein ACLFTE_04885 [Salinivenus sp.]
MQSFSSVLVRSVLAVGLVVGLVRCDWAPEADERQSLVVEAFVETGRPLPTLTLRQTRPLGSTNGASDDAATGGQVVLTLEGDTIPYDESPQRPGQYVPAGPSDTVSARTPWALDVRWNGEQARARGTTPPPLQIADVCVRVPEEPVRAVRVDSLRRDSLDIPTERGYIYPIDVTVRWTAAGLSTGADSTQWIRARLRPDTSQFSSRLVDRFLRPVEIRREDQFGQEEGQRRWTGVYAVPVDSSTAPLPPHQLTTTVVRGDSSFGNFARSRTDPDLREPISNVEGALGIATAVAVDSLAREVSAATEGCDAPSGSTGRIQSTAPSYTLTDPLITRTVHHGRARSTANDHAPGGPNPQ